MFASAAWCAQVTQHLEGTFDLSRGTVKAAKAAWKSRRSMLDSPLHGAGYCLDPEFLSDEGLALDSEKKDACVIDLLNVMEKLVISDDDRDAARDSYASLRAKEGLFGSKPAERDASRWPAHQWWEVYGSGHPQLRRMAMRVLSQVTSACACERNWSTYDFIHNKKRNRLAPRRARDLVFAFTNMRLVEKMLSPAGEEFVGWDEEEEQQESESDAGEGAE